MSEIKALIWDEWNKKHLKKHKVDIKEVEEVITGKITVKESYRNRLIIRGKTKQNRELIIILSPEDKRLRRYDPGNYYLITAFDYQGDQ